MALTLPQTLGHWRLPSKKPNWNPKSPNSTPQSRLAAQTVATRVSCGGSFWIVRRRPLDGPQAAGTGEGGGGAGGEGIKERPTTMQTAEDSEPRHSLPPSPAYCHHFQKTKPHVLGSSNASLSYPCSRSYKDCSHITSHVENRKEWGWGGGGILNSITLARLFLHNLKMSL